METAQLDPEFSHVQRSLHTPSLFFALSIPSGGELLIVDEGYFALNT